ncbi:hypothetical protein EJ06DRAFT_44096 [Trichodelitschia bisporula]|uniref:DUF7785 domain-containing protein n=1 Tax=Trichodelitschia bisporula TaxID=703511 RepID=A0A6G1HVZ3_9PEZI|nr:hypothetical protein EJ06DRAFT_44096 [Trichodelitschia bisporula]
MTPAVQTASDAASPASDGHSVSLVPATKRKYSQSSGAFERTAAIRPKPSARHADPDPTTLTYFPPDSNHTNGELDPFLVVKRWENAAFPNTKNAKNEDPMFLPPMKWQAFDVRYTALGSDKFDARYRDRFLKWQNDPSLIRRPCDDYDQDATHWATNKELVGEVLVHNPGPDGNYYFPGHEDNWIGRDDIVGLEFPTLTVFANAPVPRHLFSSFRKPVSVDVNGSTVFTVTPPPRKDLLPKFITVANFKPSQAQESNAKKGPTIGELFAPPPTVPQLHPPTFSKQSGPSNGVVTFVPHDAPRRDRRDSYTYFNQPLTVGQWLAYAGEVQIPSGSELKRRQRDRKHSTSESSDEATAQAKYDALFRRVYSSFAPSSDNTGAVVPVQTRNEIWWQKVGKWRAERLLAIDPMLLESDLEQQSAEGTEDEDAAFKDAVESFDPDSWDDPMKDVADPADPADVDQALEEVSQLLETLASYQRIRNSYPPGSKSAASELTGTPQTPTPAEIETYKTLKSALATMIAALPPTAIARLDGDKLGALKLSGNVLVEVPVEGGTLEEDQVSKMAKQAAFSAAVGSSPVPALNRGPSGNTYSAFPPTVSQYVRPAGQTQLRPQPTTYQQNVNVTPRTQPLNYQRTAPGVQTFAGNYPTQSRMSYTQPPQFTQPAPPRSANYGPTGQNMYYQQIQQLTGAGGQSQRNFPATPQHGGQQRGQFANYSGLQRTNGAAPQFSPTSGATPLRTATPHAVAPTPTPAFANRPAGAARSAYIAPTSNAAALGPSGFHTTMSSAEQQMMIERQRANLAMQQQQARIAASNVVAPGTPARASVTTVQGAQVNGTPVQGGQVNGAGNAAAASAVAGQV